MAATQPNRFHRQVPSHLADYRHTLSRSRGSTLGTRTPEWVDPQCLSQAKSRNMIAQYQDYVAIFKFARVPDDGSVHPSLDHAAE